jgi:hypothetical protein
MREWRGAYRLLVGKRDGMKEDLHIDAKIILKRIFKT